MSDTDFNEQDFLNTVQRDAVETKFTPVPVGEYSGTIKPGSVKVSSVNFRDGTVGKRFRCQWIINDDAVKASTGMTEPTVRQEFLLDLTDGGALATGKNKNIRLGKIVEAGGLPNPGWSLAMFDGVNAKVRVGHRADKDDPEVVYAEVQAVSKL